MKKSNRFSRRDFLKTSSISAVGTVALAEPVLELFTKILQENFNGITGHSMSFDVIRPSDLLHLKYYFFNAKIEGGKVKRKDDAPLFLYIQIPPQHIGEELVTEKIHDQTNPSKITKKKSFLSGNSWVALRLADNIKDFKFELEELLNWEAKFDLVTLDDFAKKVEKQKFREDYENTLKELNRQFEKISTEKYEEFRDLVLHPNNNEDPEKWPLTKLEVPYKIFLSPIAAPGQSPSNDQRLDGNYVFTGNTPKPVAEYTSKSGVSIIRPWENRLIFRDIEGAEHDPRFKAIHYLEGAPVDKDEGTELLPSPIYRAEIENLTSRFNHDRDIKADYFKISSLGASTYLNYKNDNPLENTMVAWEQRIKYGRDNYVSITFRAVDVFTGLKLQVSVIAERNYTAGVSYLQRRYYVSYAEPFKNYQNKLTVSKKAFVKITPQNQGAFISLEQFKTTNSYLVAKEGLKGKQVISEDSVICDSLPDFKYIGEDHAGALHEFTLKMVIVPAEQYKIIHGTYKHPEQDYSSGSNAINLKHIGLLAPSRQSKDGQTVLPCDKEDTENEQCYTYQVIKLFKTSSRTTLNDKTLNPLKAFVKANRNCFIADIRNELTYARIEKLKKGGSLSSTEKIVSAAKPIIDKSSSASTFETKEMLLFADLNKEFQNDDDGFLDEFPLVPYMEDTSVIISQIDQIEGQSKYRRVAFADAHFDGSSNIDETDPESPNPAKLLFKLMPEEILDDFFSENYRRSGGAVNVGIPISHVSVLDQGIAYNESHNPEKGTKELAASPVIQDVNAASIFGPKAELLGIPLLKIIGATFGVSDLPAFNYLKDVQRTIDQVDQIADEIGGIASEWRKRYRDIESNITKARNDLSKLEEELKGLAKSKPKDWIENLIDQIKASDSLLIQKTLAEKKVKEYYDKALGPIQEKIIKKVEKAAKSVNIDLKLEKEIGDTLKGDPDIDQVKTTLVRVAKAFNKIGHKNPEELFKLYIKGYCIEQISEAPTVKHWSETYRSLVEKGMDDAKEMSRYYDAMMSGIAESNAWAVKYLEESQKELNANIDAAIVELDGGVKSIIEGVLSGSVVEEYLDKGYKAIVSINALYEQYHEVYQSLQAEEYKKVANSLGVGNYKPKFDDLEKALIADMKSKASLLKINQVEAQVKTNFEALKKAFDDKLDESEKWLSDYETKYKDVAEEIKLVEKEYSRVLGKFKNLYAEKKAETLKKEQAIRELEVEIRNFVQLSVEDLKEKLKHEKQKLIQAGQRTEAYKDAMTAITNYKKVIQRLERASKQSLNYTYTTSNFKKASLAGVIDFIPVSAALNIDVNYTLNFDITSFDRPPRLISQSYHTKSNITDFKIALLKIVEVDFERVTFVTGSEIKDDFEVKIRDVGFSGPLNFVKAFEDYLNNLSNNLVFELSATSAKVAYSLSLPDITAGYFNFFNMNLSALMTLPFDPSKSLQMQFGLGSPLKKFGITVAGIFGGQGYFNLIAEPKRGIIGMVLVLEFGAIFHLHLGVAWGTAYLVGGVYIKRYLGNFEIRAYILCVGRFNVLGIFSASMSFYLGLHGNGSVLTGICVVSVTKRFSRWFKISVRCKMRKVLKGGGAATSKNNESIKSMSYESVGINSNGALDKVIVEELPSSRKYYQDESVRLTLLVPESEGLKLEVSSNEEKIDVGSLEVSDNSGSEGELLFIDIPLDDLPPDNYTLRVLKDNAGSPLHSESFIVIDEDMLEEVSVMKERITRNAFDAYATGVSDRNYYESYFTE